MRQLAIGQSCLLRGVSSDPNPHHCPSSLFHLRLKLSVKSKSDYNLFNSHLIRFDCVIWAEIQSDIYAIPKTNDVDLSHRESCCFKSLGSIFLLGSVFRQTGLLPAAGRMSPKRAVRTWRTRTLLRNPFCQQ